MVGISRGRASALILGTLLFLSSPALAYVPDPNLTLDARKALADYSDVEGVISTVARLTAAVTRAPDPLLKDDPAKNPELAFLRVAATVDLLFLARMQGDETLVQRVAEAYGTPAAELEKALRRELSKVATGPFRPAGGQVGATLALASEASPDMVALSAQRGAARDVALLSTLAKSQAEGRLRERLALLGKEPPEDPLAELEGLEPESRAVARGLARATQAAAQVRAAGAAGDPLARALCPRVSENLRELSASPQVLSFALPADTASVFQQAKLPAPRPISMLRVTEQGTTLIHAALLRMSEDGSLSSALGDGSFGPGFSALTRVEKTSAAADAALGEYCAGAGDALLGIAPVAGLDARQLTQTVLSLRRAGCANLQLLSLTADGQTAQLPLALHVGRDDVSTAREVRVRLGGYTVKLHGHASDVPRVREEGGFRFDPAALSDALARGQGAVAVSYMSGVPAQELATALHVASARAHAPAILVVP